ncbi:MAG: hypothetical protein V3V00_08695 [Saprospiraceae bacterium]
MISQTQRTTRSDITKEVDLSDLARKVAKIGVEIHQRLGASDLELVLNAQETGDITFVQRRDIHHIHNPDNDSEVPEYPAKQYLAVSEIAAVAEQTKFSLPIVYVKDLGHICLDERITVLSSYLQKIIKKNCMKLGRLG